MKRLARDASALVCVVCVAGATTLLLNGVEQGWGWLLVFAFISVGRP